MLDKFLRAPAVTALTGLSRTTIWRRERAGEFPRRRQLGGNCVGWLESAVCTWMQTRPEVHGAITTAAPSSPGRSIPGKETI